MKISDPQQYVNPLALRMKLNKYHFFHKGGYHNNIYKWKTPEGSIYLFSKIFGNSRELWVLNPKGYKQTLKFLSVKCSLFQHTSIGEYVRKLRFRLYELSGQD